MAETGITTNSPPGKGCRLCRFTVQVLTGRWLMMFASFLIMAGAGATYLFGVYSKVIKATLGYDQSTLNTLSTCKDLGANVGVLSGLIAEVTPTWVVLLIGSLMNFAGYFMIWLSVTRRISTPKVWQMCLYICIRANSQNFANTGSVVTCVKNFPEGRGMFLGLMKGYVGLSGAVFTQLYLAIYGNDGISLILLIGWLPAAISIFFIFNIRTLKLSRHPNEIRVLYENLIISVTLALVLMGLTIAQKYVNFSHKALIGSATVVCALLFLPCLIAIREEFYTWRLNKEEARKAPSGVLVEEPPLIESKHAEEIEPEIVELVEYSKPMVEEKKETSWVCLRKTSFEMENTSYSYDDIFPRVTMHRRPVDRVALPGFSLHCFVVDRILLRTRKYYQTDIYKRFRDEMEKNEKEMAALSTGYNQARSI
ncbi:unnamed protein product [Fraxinus pennsylvanica]|uniref:Nodulin-like domain-containing protein n=1 Tax=Fraxinus pennsylvanica TaxID=56036 RepID=A0AAD1ZB42_9LAMI|nr:unnamed protein product [Fraxinus pennsylvanica]